MIKFFRYFFWIATIAIMVTVFSFSSQVAEESQETSEGFTVSVLKCFDWFNELTEEKQTEFVVGVQFVVRKGAHFSAYAALGLCLFSAMNLTFKFKKLWLWSFLVCAIYAISDEFHQYFVPGRSMELRDVLIDSSGAMLGILIVLFVVKIYKNKKVCS